MNRKALRIGNGGVFVLLAITAAWSANAQVYSAIELDTLGRTESRAYDINSTGQVVGYVGSRGMQRAVRWDGAAATELGTLGGDISWATAMNDTGQVVGTADTATSTHAVVWNGTTPTDLTALLIDKGEPASFTAYGINDAGQIAGSVYREIAGAQAAIWNGTNVIDLGVSGWAYDLNNAGQAVGETQPSSPHGDSKAFIWNGTTITDLGFGGAFAINEAGQAVGYAGKVLFPQASLWSGATATDLGPGIARDINDAGQVVGGGALWNGTTKVDLNSAVSAAVTSKVTLLAVAINDDGWIAANGDTTVAGALRTHAYLLIPLNLAVSPRALSFEAQRVGSTSSPLTIDLTNTGGSSFTVGSLYMTGNFSETDNCGGTLAAGASCAIQVTFQPAVAGEQTGALTVGSGLKSYVIPVTGTGTIDATLTASASRVTVGAPLTLTWSSLPGATCTPTFGSPDDGWTGTLAATGSMQITENGVGDYSYGITCSAGGVTTTPPRVFVTFILPSVTLSATTPTVVTVGQSVTLSWSSENAASCVASGGQAGDGWAGSKAISGAMSVRLLSAGTFDYTIVCSSAPQSAQATQQVVATAPARTGGSGGGGGSFDLLSLGLILASRVLKVRRGTNVRSGAKVSGPSGDVTSVRNPARSRC
jgi:probable HAF family extracellular repeat protein